MMERLKPGAGHLVQLTIPTRSQMQNKKHMPCFMIEMPPLHFAVNKLEMEQEWTLVSSTCPSSQEVDIWAGPWDYSHDPVEKNERHLPLLFQFWS